MPDKSCFHISQHRMCVIADATLACSIRRLQQLCEHEPTPLAVVKCLAANLVIRSFDVDMVDMLEDKLLCSSCVSWVYWLS